MNYVTLFLYLEALIITTYFVIKTRNHILYNDEQCSVRKSKRSSMIVIKHMA